MNLRQLQGEKKVFVAETIIFEEGEPGDYMYIVLSGRVCLHKKVVDRTQRLLHIVERGGYFGEIALITGEKRSASAKAIEATEVIQIDKEGLYKLLKDEPEFGVNMIRQMSERLKKTSEELIYSELEMALSRRKPERFQEAYNGKMIFLITGLFRLEDKKEVLNITKAVKWPDNVDLIVSLFKPGKDQESLIYVIATDHLKTLLNAISCFKDLVRWEFAPALPAESMELNEI